MDNVHIMDIVLSTMVYTYSQRCSAQYCLYIKIEGESQLTSFPPLATHTYTHTHTSCLQTIINPRSCQSDWTAVLMSTNLPDWVVGVVKTPYLPIKLLLIPAVTSHHRRCPMDNTSASWPRCEKWKLTEFPVRSPSNMAPSHPSSTLQELVREAEAPVHQHVGAQHQQPHRQGGGEACYATGELMCTWCVVHSYMVYGSMTHIPKLIIQSTVHDV